MDGREIGNRIRIDVDKAYAHHHQSGFRTHLGISVIGKECPRAIWYGFRWIKKQVHKGRLLRLFNTGHMAEPRVIEWLSEIGALVEPVDPETGKQWLTSFFGGHYGGSCDGKVYNLERYGLEGKGLLECKTAKSTAHNYLAKHGLVKAELTHYVQMQEYMAHFGLSWALYVSVNKDTDELYIEVVPARPETAAAYRQRAWDIVNTQIPPKRISEKSSYFVCKMCPYHDECHHRETTGIEINCRSCRWAVANTNDGTWYCTRWQATIPDNVIPQGCGNGWEPIA